jgi:hypothetical protein
VTARIDMGAIFRRRHTQREAEAAAAAQKAATRADLAAAIRPPSNLTETGGLAVLAPRLQTTGLPPVKIAKRHHPGLGDHLGMVERARDEARQAAQAWLQTLPGGSSFRQAVDEERQRVYASPGESIPPTEGPLHRLLTLGQSEALVVAWQAELLAEYREARAREYGTSIKDDLSALADTIQHEIESLWVTARNERNRRAFEDGHGLCPAWNEVASLHEWAAAPSKPYRSRRPVAIPRALRWPEQKAAEALGIYRAVVDAVQPEDVEVTGDADSRPQGVVRRMLGRGSSWGGRDFG